MNNLTLFGLTNSNPVFISNFQTFMFDTQLVPYCAIESSSGKHKLNWSIPASYFACSLLTSLAFWFFPVRKGRRLGIKGKMVMGPSVIGCPNVGWFSQGVAPPAVPWSRCCLPEGFLILYPWSLASGSDPLNLFLGSILPSRRFSRVLPFSYSLAGYFLCVPPVDGIGKVSSLLHYISVSSIWAQRSLGIEEK